MVLEELGWDSFFEEAFAPYREQGLVPARLIRDNNVTQGALVEGERRKFDEHEVIVSGKLYHDAETDAELPAVGDWVGLDFSDESDFPVIRVRLPRRTCLSRKAAGRSAEEQVMAANVDTVCLVTDAGVDFNERRMERYFAIIDRSGAKPLVLINKSDLYDKDVCDEAIATLHRLNPEAEVHVISVEKEWGLKCLKTHLTRGKTVAFVGSSGVGKSALINYLLGGDFQWTGEVDEGTGKGRHTTTARELMVLRRGGIIMDNPGIKEVQMWTDEHSLRAKFNDIDALAAQCRFGDCKHGTDAGCALRAAVEGGTLDEARYAAFLKLEEEVEELRRRRIKRQMTVERRFKRDNQGRNRNKEDHNENAFRLKPRARNTSAQDLQDDLE